MLRVSAAAFSNGRRFNQSGRKGIYSKVIDDEQFDDIEDPQERFQWKAKEFEQTKYR